MVHSKVSSSEKSQHAPAPSGPAQFESTGSVASGSPRVAQLKALQEAANNSPQVTQLKKLQAVLSMEDRRSLS